MRNFHSKYFNTFGHLGLRVSADKVHLWCVVIDLDSAALINPFGRHGLNIWWKGTDPLGLANHNAKPA